MFSVGCNVALNKEHRFVGMYLHMHDFFEMKCVLAYLWRAGGNRRGCNEFLRELLLYMYGQQLGGKPYAKLVLESLTKTFLCYLMQNHNPDIAPGKEMRISRIQQYSALHWRDMTLSSLALQFLYNAFILQPLRPGAHRQNVHTLASGGANVKSPPLAGGNGLQGGTGLLIRRVQRKSHISSGNSRGNMISRRSNTNCGSANHGKAPAGDYFTR